MPHLLCKGSVIQAGISLHVNHVHRTEVLFIEMIQASFIVGELIL